MEEGRRFSTYTEFKLALEEWRKATFQTFAIRRSERFPEDHRMAASLEYSMLEYGCVYGGDFQQKGKGQCPAQQSRGDGCPVFLKAGLIRCVNVHCEIFRISGFGKGS